MTEKNFSSEITRSLNKAGVWNFKIPDIGNVRKPFDRIVDIHGKCFGIEEKLSKVLSFNFKSKVRPHQIEELLRMQYGYFLINYRIPKLSINESYLINAWFINDMMRAGKKSLEYRACQTVFRYDLVSWDPKQRVWNIVEILKNIK